MRLSAASLTTVTVFCTSVCIEWRLHILPLTVSGINSALQRHLADEKWAWPWARGAPQNWGFPFNKPAMTEGSDFKIGNLVGFAKVHHKILPRRKRAWPWATGAPRNLGFPFNIYAMAESIDKRYYIEKLQILCKKQSLYTSVMDSRIENSKNWNCEFTCGARRRCDDVLYN